MEAIKLVKVMLVSASGLFREGMKQLLVESRYRIEICAAGVDEAPGKLQDRRDVEVVIFEIAAKPMGALDHIRKVRHVVPHAHLIVLGDDTVLIELAHLLGNEVGGYVLKDTSPDAFVALLNLIMLGQHVFPASLLQPLMEGRGGLIGCLPSESSTGLSERELEILRSLVGGASNKAIANRLAIQESTVKAHMKATFRKIRTKNRTQAAIWAVEHGIDGQPEPSPADHGCEVARGSSTKRAGAVWPRLAAQVRSRA